MTSCGVTVFNSRVNKCERLLCVGFFSQLRNFTLPVASRVQYVMTVFGAVTPSVFETKVFCLTIRIKICWFDA